jgi:hypothetical protein
MATLTKKTQAERFFERLQNAFAELTPQYASPEQLSALSGLIDAYSANVGGGDNSEWQSYYPSFLPVREDLLSLKRVSTGSKREFAIALEQVVVMAWNLQLCSPPQGDQILQKIWLIAGEIADDLL